MSAANSQCNPRNTKFETATPNPDIGCVSDISPEELAGKAASVRIIDVRRPEEYTGELGHITGSSLIVLDTLPQRIDELPKDETIVFVCRSGARSARAAYFAMDHGLQNVFNMKGGMILWNELELPVER